MRFALWILLALCIAVPARTASANETFSFQNPSTQIIFTTNDHGLEVSSYSFIGTHFFIPPDELNESLASQNPLGSQLHLFTEHPLDSDEALPMPTSFTAAPETNPDASTTVLILSGSTEQLRIDYHVSFKDYSSEVLIKTTVTNTSGDTLEFFPTDRTSFSAEFGISNMPGLETLQFIPMEPSQDATASVSFHVGAPTSPEFKLHTPDSIWQTQFRDRNTRVSLKRSDDWIAVRSRRGSHCMSIEYETPQALQNTRDNVISFTASGNAVADASGFLQLEDDAAYQIGSMWIHGKVSLSPDESYEYTQQWSAGTLPVPIVDVRDGVMIYRELEVSATENFFQLVGCMGSPINGLARVEVFGHDDELLRVSPVPILDPRRRGTSIHSDVYNDFPVYLSSQIQFGLSEEELDMEDVTPWSERASRVRVVVVDESDTILSVLGEATAPWPAISQ